MVCRRACLLAEVLSPSSHERDKVTKLAAYKRLASLQAYLVVDPESRTISAHVRGSTGRWITTTYAEGGWMELRVPTPC